MSRTACKTIVIVFLGMIFAVPVSQAVWEKAAEHETPRVLSLFKKTPTGENLRSFEKDLEESSWVAEAIRPIYRQARWLLLRDLGDKAVPGADGWAYYHPDIRYLGEAYFRARKPEGPTEDPAIVIADFAEQLGRRGIHLLVVPVPSKPAVAPERLRRGLAPSLDLDTHTRRFMGELRGRGLDVFDLHAAFVAQRLAYPDGPPLYLAADTHWTGEGVRLAASLLATRVRAAIGAEPLQPSRDYRRETVAVPRRPDIPRMSRLPGEAGAFPKETTTVFRALDQEGEPYADDDEAQILLLGDSFSRIYQTDEPEAAGLIANLAYELQTPLSSIVNDGGASTLVRQELARNLDLLHGKRIVIWAFAERDLRFGLQGWQKIALEE
jgi:hypothetical protein